MKTLFNMFKVFAALVGALLVFMGVFSMLYNNNYSFVIIRELGSLICGLFIIGILVWE